MRRKDHVRIEPRTVERAPAPTAPDAPAPAYPSMADAARVPELASLVRAAVRAAACIGLLGAAGAASGCEPPECAPTRWGEVKAHAPSVLSDATSLRLRFALDEVGVAFGISPHPAPAMMAGEAMMVGPATPVPPSTPPVADPDPSAGTP